VLWDTTRNTWGPVYFNILFEGVYQRSGEALGGLRNLLITSVLHDVIIIIIIEITHQTRCIHVDLQNV